ncbi:hypothetical protein FQN55_003484 [Onygenales sp. PD_40]|nr:hypothetical protein FQN55_003484 [Onygenales sp. PD_40]KAK2786461.1 hypothetical protein FQN53_006617 [Emmonsiellopsis sp. PD_33]KAK2793559.1 hypothetical protein FQN52_001145 [Onygenales sp. PD_12]KAK2805370.1 hypothetical protein FQN51_000196 [Onygenales sp. PD_10]
MLTSIMIAVDFGTTYSGLAFSDPSQRTDSAIPISDWGRGVTSQKVPSEIQFTGPGNGQFKWGFQIKHGQERHIWFKLDLDPDNSRTGKLTQLSRTLKDLFVSPPEYQRSTEDIVAAYLTGLRRHAVAHLEKLYGQAVIKECQLDWIITVPAVWSDNAKKKTRNAALRAGMGDTTSLQMTSEPEAAAVYALKALDPHHIKVGESVVICDAGGGTVDLITYKMKSVTYPYEVEETAIGGGSQCGSTFLNRKFEEVLMKKLNGKPISKNAKAMAMNHFEKETKRNFGTEDEDEDEEDIEFQIPIPGVEDDPSVGICAGFLEMTYAEMKEVFQPVMTEVLMLLNEQLKAAIKEGPISAVILVGGFGESTYLYRQIKEAVAPVPVLQPPNGWTAIVRGAVMKGKSQLSTNPSWQVKSRYCRGNYGLLLWMPWKEGMPTDKKVWDKYEGVYKHSECMQWCIKRGDKVQESAPKSFPLYRAVPLDDPLVFSSSIYYSPVDGSKAPVYLNGDCREHCVLNYNLSSIPRSKFKRKAGFHGEDYYEVEYSVDVTYFSAEMKFELVCQGEKYGSVTAKWLE